MTHFFVYSVFALLFISQQQLCNSETIPLHVYFNSGATKIVDLIWNKPEIELTDSEKLRNCNFSQTKLSVQLRSLSKKIVKSLDYNSLKKFLREDLKQLTNIVRKIENFYKKFVVYNKTHTAEQSTNILLDAKSILSDDSAGIIAHLSIIDELLYDSILPILHDSKKTYASTCSTSTALQTVQQISLNIFSYVTFATAKCYLTLLTAVELLHLYEKGAQYDTISKDVRTEIDIRHRDSLEVLRLYIKEASREVWRCDPSVHIEDITYTDLKNLFQKYIIPQTNLAKPDVKCDKSCEGYGNSTYTDTDCIDKTGPFKEFCQYWRKCTGELWDCSNEFHMDIKSTLHVCNSELKSSRRYDYVEKIVGRKAVHRYGHSGECGGRIISINNELGSAGECEACVCTCAEYRNSDAYISLEAVFSDTSKNRVVTGVRLVKKAKTIRIEIQEGTLGTIGTIVNNDAEWVSRDYDKPIEEDIANNYAHKIEWNGGRGINLNELHAPLGHVVVGLKFEKNKMYPELGVYLVMFTQPYNPMTGELLIGDFYNMPYRVTASDIPNRLILDLDAPFLATRKNIALEQTDMFLNFTTTGLHVDVGQTVIPLFDTQEVTTSIHVPMSGVGLYFKSNDILGGFLGLKLFTINLATIF